MNLPQLAPTVPQHAPEGTFRGPHSNCPPNPLLRRGSGGRFEGGTVGLKKVIGYPENRGPVQEGPK
jgi:hypothetical protein